MKNKKPFLESIEHCTIDDIPKTKKEKTLIKITAMLITIVSAVLIIYTLINSNTLQEEFIESIAIYGYPSIFILSFLLDLIPQLVSPMAILFTSLVAGFNPLTALSLVSLGSFLGSLLGFTIGKKYVCKAVVIFSEKKVARKLTELTNKYGKIIVPLAAVSPLPYLPVLLGAMNLSRKNFIIYGVIPRTISFIIVTLLVKAF